MIGRCADGRVTDSIPPLYDYDLIVLAGFILLLLVLISEPLGWGSALILFVPLHGALYIGRLSIRIHCSQRWFCFQPFTVK